MASRSRGAFVWVGVAAALAVVASLATYAWRRTLPMFDPEEVAEARAVLDTERRELLEAPCARTAIGSAEPTNQAAFDDLAFGRRWDACRELAANEAIFDSVTDEAGHTTGWDHDHGDGEDLPPPVPGATYMGNAHPPGRSPLVDAAEAACDGLEEAVARLAATPDLCTPARPSPAGWDPDLSLRPMIHVARGVVVRARRAAREGRTFEALRLLVSSLALTRDFRRGPANLLAAMVAVAAEGVLVSHTVSLLFAEPSLSVEQYASLHATLETLQRDAIEPHTLWRAERNAAAELAGRDSETSELMVMSATSLDLSWCPEGSTAEACLQALRALEPRSDGLPSDVALVALGPRGNRDAMLRWAHDELLQTYDSYAARIVNADANLGMLRAALAWVEARSHGGACPPTLSEEWRSLPTSDERIEVVLFDGDNYEMQAPPLRAHPSFERTVFNLVCPAARAAWFDADGNRVPDAGAPHADTTDAEAEADERNEGGARAPD